MTTTEIEALVAEMSDADKLRALADWFDSRDDVQGNFLEGQRECQRDLRRMADAIERTQDVVEAATRYTKFYDEGDHGNDVEAWRLAADAVVDIRREVKSLAALDAKPGELKFHPWKQGSGGPGCAKCGGLLSHPIHAKPEGEG